MPASNVTRRKILFFALVFLPVFALCLWLYPRVQPVYQKAVVSAIDVGLHRLEPPMRIEIREDGGWATHTIRPDGTEQPYWARPGKNLTLFFLGLALLPALLIATPVDLRRRVGLLGAGMLLLYVLHILAGFGLVLSIRCLANDPSVLVCKWAKTVGNTFGQVSGFVIWGLLTWQVWIPREEASGAPAPVESGTIGRGLLVRNPGVAVACFVALGVLLVAHAGQFSNGFHDADSDAIVDNLSIRSLGNTGKFFADPRTSSSRLDRAVYRPVLTLSYAVDFWAGGRLQARQFHHTQFALLFAAGILSAVAFRRIYDLARTGPENRYVALVAAALLCLHVANVATINDFTARPDLVAALCVAASFWLYLARPERRRLYLYLLPMFVGAFAGSAALAFAPLLVAFAWFFEEQRTLGDLLRRSEWPRLGAVLRRCAPALLFGLLLFVFSRWMGEAAAGGGWKQLVQLPYVWLHHARLFLVPFGLTADPGWSHPSDRWVLTALAGLVFLVVLTYAIERCSRVSWLRPTAFGLVWFVVASAASSSLRVPPESYVPRPSFLAYVGFCFAVVWLVASVLRRLHDGGIPAVRWIAAGLAVVLLATSAMATRKRHEVWESDETLWADAVGGNPGSARSQMNYGRALLAENRLGEATKYLESAAAERTGSPMLELELARAAGAENRTEDAEIHFDRAVQLDPRDPRIRRVFARWLAVWGRGPESIEQLEIAAEIGPADVNARWLLMNLYAASRNEAELQSVVQATLEILPSEYVAQAYAQGRIPVWASEENAEAYEALAKPKLDSRRWVDAAVLLRHVVTLDPSRNRSLHRLGWAQTQLGFHEGAEASYRQALEIVPDTAALWNDLGWALAQQMRFEESFESFERAIRISPRYALARDNLAWAREQARQHAAEATAD